MKKLLSALLILLSISTFATSADSTHVDSVKLKPKVSGYLSVGLSITNSPDFLASNYASLEGGIMYRDFGAGLVFGRGSLKGLGAKDDNINNYFLEGKVSYSRPIKMITGTVFFGYGGYLGTKQMFIEYGVGASYSYKNASFGVAVSNWDKVWYLTPNISYNF
jgi:hypothetical protein